MLTLAIPTYNRAQHLDTQLQWLASVLPGHEDDVQIVVSDNASTDGTPAVVERWKRLFAKADFTYQRHETNIGAVPNMASCIRFASQPHVWVISDDDMLGIGALDAVLSRIEERPDLGLLTLNFSSRYANGPLRFSQCYPVEEERHDPQGKQLAGACLYFDEDGMGLVTAQVYRTDLAKEALAMGPAETNLLAPVFWSAYCASHGGMVLTAETFLECRAGSHFWTENPLLDLRMHLADSSELSQRLFGIGYEWRVSYRLVIRQLSPRSLRVLVASFRLQPWTALRVTFIFALAVRRAGLRWASRFVVGKLRKRLARVRVNERERLGCLRK